MQVANLGALDAALKVSEALEESEAPKMPERIRCKLGTLLPPIPFQMTQWRIAVLVLRPAKVSSGGIMLADEALDVDALMSNVGILVSMGANAFKSVTKAGLDLAAEPNNPKLGDYVMYAQHAGNLIKVKGQDPKTGEPKDIEFRVMNDSDVLGVTNFPHVFRYYL